MNTKQALFDVISHKMNRMRLLGIDVHLQVRYYEDEGNTDPEIYGFLDRYVCPAASVNKLAVALHWLTLGETSFTWEESDRRLGAGYYDQSYSELTANKHELLYDMIAKSGNTAMVVLGRGLARIINRQLDYRQFNETQLIERGEEWFETGNTSPNDAIKMLSTIEWLHGLAASNVRHALEHGKTYVPAIHDVVIRRKYGALNPEHAGERFVRNEVGRIEKHGWNKDKDERVPAAYYAVFTQSKTRLQAKLAEQFIGQVGAVMASSVGGSSSRITSALGKTALTL